MLFLRALLQLKNNNNVFKHARNMSVDSKKIKNISFVGLGNMGSRMCNNLLKKGYNVYVYDVVEENRNKLKSIGATVLNSELEIGNNVDCIITMLPAGPDVENLYIGKSNLLSLLKPGTIVIDSSTVNPNTPVLLNEKCQSKNVLFVDAPVSGGVIAAEKGTLTFMVGGNASTVELCKPVLLAMGTNVVHCGHVGCGQITKICNNMLLAISMIGTSEVMNLGIKMGIDPKILSSVINVSSGRNWSSEVYNPVPGVMENVPSSNNYNPGFTCQLILKDLKIGEEIVKKSKSATPLANEALKIYKHLCKDRHDKDFSIVYSYLKDMNKK